MNIIDLVAIVPFYISIILSGSYHPPLTRSYSAPGLHDMKIISKAGTMIRLVSEKHFSLLIPSLGESDEDPSHFQDGSSFRRPPKYPLHIARGLEGAGDHHAGGDHHHAHLL
jgi:hypothetical protein